MVSGQIYLFQVLLLEKEMATHFSTLAWKIPWKEEPGRLQSMELQRVGHNSATSLQLLFKDTKKLGGGARFEDCVYLTLYAFALFPSTLLSLA